ncbi:MAG TPA: peptidylprolyl isomerase [Opitutaceae bacterium]|nr:peptidylprolyl isomerase [Opitutaceae bacterium]
MPADDSRAAMRSELPEGIYAEIETSHGTMVAQLFADKAPLTVGNFVGLAEGKLGPEPGKPFYQNLTFHRVVPGFVVQGGDPTATGEGGPGYKIPDDLTLELSHDAPGILSMANDGPDTNGSQFFITLGPAVRLDFLHSVFGRIIHGIQNLEGIREGDRMNIKILRVGSAAKAFRADDKTQRERVERLLRNRFDTSDQVFFFDPNSLLPHDPPRARLYDQQLMNLARVTGIRRCIRVETTADDREAVEPVANGVLAIYTQSSDRWTILDRTMMPGRREGYLLGLEREARRRAAAFAEGKPSPLSPDDQLRCVIDGMVQAYIAEARRAKHLETR